MPILTPFAVSAVLAYLGDPWVDRLEVIQYRGFRLNRTTAVLLVFVAIFAAATTLFLIIVPTVEYQIEIFIQKLPSYLQWFNQSIVPILQKYLGKGIRPIKIDQLLNLVRGYWQDGEAVSQSILQSVSHSGAILIGWVMNLILIPVITFYLLRDWDVLVAGVHDLFPRRSASVVALLAREADNVLGAFLRGQFYVMLSLAGIYSAGLWMVGLDLALPIGLTAGLISFVPYMGAAVGIISASIAALLQFQDVFHWFWVLAVFAIGQSMEGMLLTPWLVGNKIGLHPVAVIFAVLAGGQVFGFLGILIALPLASIIMVLLRHAHKHYTYSDFYSGGSSYL